MVEKCIIRLIFDNSKLRVALFKYVLLFQFDSICYQNTFSHFYDYGHIIRYYFPHMIEPVAYLHLSYMELICSIHKIINV